MTHYSGYDGAEIAFSFVEHYLKKAGYLRSDTRCVLPLHACDYASLAQRALPLPDPLNYEHIFCDMLDRVPKPCRKPGSISLCVHAMLATAMS